MSKSNFDAVLPSDHAKASLAGRVWRPEVKGPSVIAIRDGRAIDITAAFATIRDLCEEADPSKALHVATGDDIGAIADIIANSAEPKRNTTKPWLLAPADLQAMKAAGVTFAVSMLERVIEERARGDAAQAVTIRQDVQSVIGDDLSKLVPGSPEAMRLKDWLIGKGLWSQYLEVGIGPDAEIFTKAQPMASVGFGALAGLHPASTWNNPEPEVALAVSSAGAIVGATLANDVNLRDVEGRSALLLGKAKDNNASSAIGPFLRFFDDHFTLDSVRRMTIDLTVEGKEGFKLQGSSSISKISRDPADLVRQMIGPHHQYPDGAFLLLGTMFAPVQDRDAPGRGFTHKEGDVVTIAAPELGRLINTMTTSDKAPPWTFGASHLLKNLAARGLLKAYISTRPSAH